jgi:hypothetical protein
MERGLLGDEFNALLYYLIIDSSHVSNILTFPDCLRSVLNYGVVQNLLIFELSTI